MTHARTRRPGRIAALVPFVAIAALALAACSAAATTAPSSVPTMPPVTPAPSVSAAPAGSAAAVASPDLSKCPKAATDIVPLKAGETKTVTIETTAGTIVTQVSGDLAPIAAGNFVDLAQCGYFDGVVFHRTVPGFVIQGGDGQFGRAPIASPDHMGRGGPGYTFNDEPVVGEYVRGALAMANAGANTNGSQFFIMLADTPAMPKDYTIFGKVTQGMDVVDAIAAAPQSGSPDNIPNDPVVMTKVTVSN